MISAPIGMAKRKAWFVPCSPPVGQPDRLFESHVERTQIVRRTA
jgi:hypothetical protein